VAATVNGNFVPDEVLVRFTAIVSDQAIENFAQSQRLVRLTTHRLTAINAVMYRFRITDQRLVPAVIGSAQGDARVALIQPNYLYALQDAAPPAAPAAPAASAAPNGDPIQYVVSKMHLPQAHDLATGERVLIAVVDSAIDSTHAELKGVVAGRFDTFKGDPAPHKHGTAMASAIAAHGRLMGVAPAAHILAVRAFDDAPAGAHATTTRILDGLQWVANSGARVVNMSFTGPEDTSVHDMVASIRRKGMVLVAAAGNEGPQAAPAYPAAYPEVIAVTATDADDKLLNVANHGSYVAVAAPGVDIFVAVPGGSYEFTTGTSVATAHVSGLAALLIASNPSLTPDTVQAVLMRTAKDLGPPGRDDEFGAGLVDAYEALLTQAPATADRTATH
jgi:subtilisin family serine protease